MQPENLAAPLTDAALAWLDELPRGASFALWIHYQEPHGPYTPRGFAAPSASGPELPRSPSQSGRGAIPRYQWLGHGRLHEYEARYDGEVAEVDRQLGRLLDGLRRRELLDRSILVFTADHGESFGEAGLYCAHGEGLDESLLRVPLLLRAPGVEPGVRRDAVRLIDVAPTLLELLGLPATGLSGLSLLEERGDRPLVAQVATRNGRHWRALRDGGFELVEGSDGRTLRPLDPRGASGEAPAHAQRRRLEAELARLAPWPVAGPAAPLEGDEAEALRAMGYAE